MNAEMKGIMSNTTIEVDESLDDPVLRRIRAFETIRDIRYVLRDASYRLSIDGEPPVSQGVGGCGEKARSLWSALRDNCDLRYGVVEFYWQDTLKNFLPTVPEPLIKKAGKLPFCFHKFLFARINDNWILIDPTWDAGLRKSGLPVNMEWNGLTETKLAVSPAGDLMQFANEEELISYTNSSYERRRDIGDLRWVRLKAFNEFVFAMNQWLEVARDAYKPAEIRSAGHNAAGE